MTYNNRQKSRLTSGSLDKNGVLAKLQETLIPPHPKMDVILPSVSSIGEDGVDHINIHLFGATRLGKGMHPRTQMRLDHPFYGSFGSVDNFHQWFITEERDDRLRFIPPAEINSFMWERNYKKILSPETDFRIMEACWLVISSHGAASDDMRKSTLPFDMYRPSSKDIGEKKNNAPLRIRPPFAYWMVPAYEEIRKALKENRAPDLFGLLKNAEDRENITTLAMPSAKPKKPKPPKQPKVKGAPREKVSSGVDVSSMAEVDREQATEYGNPTDQAGNVELTLTDAYVAEVMNVTGIANPEDTMEEGGKSVQELVKDELKDNFGLVVDGDKVAETFGNPIAQASLAVATIAGDKPADVQPVTYPGASDERFALNP